MKALKALRLTATVLLELLFYDLLMCVGGFALARRILPRASGRPRPDSDCHRICDAINWAMAFYWKPVLCLQNSMVTARLLRRSGFAAEVVIGCRPEPFFSHAWVEIDGRVVNDSSVYRQQLHALARL